MASLSLNGIKRRIKSVKSLSKATKAMGMMANLKMPAAIEQMECSEEYFTEVYNSLQDVAHSVTGHMHPFTKTRKIKKSCFVVISADRGFVAGYHSNLWKKVKEEIRGSEAIFLPLGKKAREYVRKNSFGVIDNAETFQKPIDKLDMIEIMSMAYLLAKQYRNGLWDELIIVYTHFQSMLKQTPSSLQVLPLFKENEMQESDEQLKTSVLYEPSVETVLDSLVPQFIFGLLYGAITQAYASEIAARKVAMDTANKNAGELRDQLYLQYNRLRQEMITQELSEIVGGSKKLKKENENA